MPSPIAHASVGYLLYAWDRACHPPIPPTASRLAAIVALALLPDADASAGILLGDFGRYHNNLTHSALAGLTCAGTVWLAVRLWRPREAVRWGLLALLCYGLHLAMDWVTVGRGVMLAWPFSAHRFQAPFKLFYGLRWGDALFSARHVETLLNELPLALVAALVCHRSRFRSAAPAPGRR